MLSASPTPATTVSIVRVLRVVFAIVLTALVLFLVVARGRGTYALIVSNHVAWLQNSRDGTVVGPIEVQEFSDGEYVLTGGNPIDGINVTFRDETRLPGRITFEVSGKLFDVMERGVYIDGEYHNWQAH